VDSSQWHIPLSRDIYIIVCYFPPASSSFFVHNDFDGDPYIDLYIGITQYLEIGEVILLVDFNAHTIALQIPLHDLSEDAFCTHEMDLKTMELHRLSDDALGPITAYGRHLLHLGESHKSLILNDLPCFSGSNHFTCFPHIGGASVVDHVMTNLDLLPYVHHFSITPIPLVDHALLSFSLTIDPPSPPSPLWPTIIFNKRQLDIFSTHLHQLLPPKSLFSSLNSTSTKYDCLSSIIWEVTLKSYPHITQYTSLSPNIGSCPMNQWYDTNCKPLHSQLRHAFSHDRCSYPSLKPS
jgi:hypothetical protein